MTAQESLIERLRELFSDQEVLREVSMFGGRSFMVNESLAVSALKGGNLLVRVPADQHADLLTRPGAIQAEMGTGRTMGPGWLEVTAPAISSDKALASWVGVALEHNRTAARAPH